MFNKKFKVRVRHFNGNYYVVEYAHYYLLPTWHALQYWFNQGLTAGTECWSTDLFNYKRAEEIASTLKSLDDVDRWHLPDLARKKLFIAEREEYYKKNVPYYTKYFN